MYYVSIAMQSDIGERLTKRIVGKKSYLKNKKEPVVGFEPTTCSLRSSYSTTELHRLVIDCCITVALPQSCNAPLFVPKLLLNALTRPQEVHWTQSIITLTASRCQAFFSTHMRLSSFPIPDGFYSFKPFQRRASWCINAAQQSNLTVAISRTL